MYKKLEDQLAGGGNVSLRPTVLCYNLKGTKKGKQIGMIFGFLGYKVRHVEPSEYLVPVGVLAGIEMQRSTDHETEAAPDAGRDAGGGTESVPEGAEYTGHTFTDEMLVMNAGTEELLDKALFLMKKEKVRVDLKAMVTPTNSRWTSLALHDEILKEHAAIHS